MTSASITGRMPSGSFGARLADIAAGLHRSLMARRKRRHDRRALVSLDDRLLRDIGLSRADVMRSCASVRFPETWRNLP